MPPSSNRYWRMVGGRLLVSAAAKSYKLEVGWLARQMCVELLRGPVCVTVHVFRARKAGDLDNFCKILLDSMQGIFYENDAQVRELHAYLADDRHTPRVELTVQPMLE